MTNRQTGNAFELELCGLLASHGFWVHRMTQSAAGQPFDIIAVRNGQAYAIDAKVCEHDIFRRTRIEPNQRNAMRYWDDCGNDVGWFALKVSTGIYMMSLPLLDMNPSTSYATILQDGIPLEKWVTMCK